MGVPKLLSTLTPFGERKPLGGARVIIDGPALAYHVVSICLADPVLAAGRNHPLDQPTYGQLGQAAIAWLDQLRGQDVEIQALFFDGFLPEAKRPVRLERSYRTSAQLHDVFGFYQRDNLPGFDVKGPRTGSLLPAPPFSVPAVLDALRGSALYGPLTTVVPGEADTFCAEHARTAGGGTVITSDSDLLVQDLGPDAEVVLFRDIDVRGAVAGKPLVVPTYSLATVCQKLGLPADKGMYAFAFELSMDPHLSTGELAEQAKREVAACKWPEAYAEFTQQFAYPSQLAKAAEKHDITGLDPRLSELVLQCLFPSEAAASRKGGRPRSDILAFAPPLLDSCTRTTAWEASAYIRCCAFSLLQVAAARRIKGVREYTRMASMATRGSDMALLPVAELGQALGALTMLLRRIQAAVKDPDLQWTILASYQDLQWSKENAKEAVCLEVLCQETPGSGVLDRVTWNGVHWLAQIQGTLYSLRLLAQTAGFVRREADKSQLGDALSLVLADLEGVLRALVPPLADYPSLRALRDLPARLKTACALELLSELAELPNGIQFKAGAKKNRNKSRGKKRKRTLPDQAAGSSKAAAAVNPFSILDGVD